MGIYLREGELKKNNQNRNKMISINIFNIIPPAINFPRVDTQNGNNIQCYALKLSRYQGKYRKLFYFSVWNKTKTLYYPFVYICITDARGNAIDKISIEIGFSQLIFYFFFLSLSEIELDVRCRCYVYDRYTILMFYVLSHSLHII